MIDDLKAMAIFAEVAKRQSFREAAKALSLSPSVVSYHISKLEEKLGSALIYRSTRKLSLSYEGEVFYSNVLKMLDAANQGIAQLSNGQNEPRGKIKISLPTALSTSFMNERIAQFSNAYPNITLDIDYSDTRRNIVDDSVDLTIRAGELEDSDFIAKKIAILKRILVCSPSFYLKHKNPKTLEDIAKWKWIKLRQLSNQRTFESSGKNQTIKFNNQLTVNSVEAIHQLCLNGLGLAVLAESQVKDDIKRGELQTVLPDWKVKPLPLFALWSKNIPPTSNVKVLLSFLV